MRHFGIQRSNLLVGKPTFKATSYGQIEGKHIYPPFHFQPFFFFKEKIERESCSNDKVIFVLAIDSNYGINISVVDGVLHVLSDTLL